MHIFSPARTARGANMIVTPLSDACERNKGPILEVLRDAFARTGTVLELGSGTGQHALCFGEHLPHLAWQPSDCGDYLPGLRERISAAALPNVAPPLEIDVRRHPWPVGRVDGVFTANTLHIMSWPAVEELFRGIGAVLAPGGVLCIYGPFAYEGRHTSASNAEFDRFLRARDPDSGIRDAAAVEALARAQGLVLREDRPMPANNRTLIFTRPAAPLSLE